MPYRHAAAQGGPVAGNQAAAAQLQGAGDVGVAKAGEYPASLRTGLAVADDGVFRQEQMVPGGGFAVQVYPAPLAVGEIVLQHRPFLQAQSAAVETDQGAGASGRFPAAVHHNVPQGQGGAAGDREQDAGEAVAPGQNMAAADNVDVIGDKQTFRAADGEAAGQCDGGQPPRQSGAQLLLAGGEAGGAFYRVFLHKSFFLSEGARHASRLHSGRGLSLPVIAMYSSVCPTSRECSYNRAYSACPAAYNTKRAP